MQFAEKCTSLVNLIRVLHIQEQEARFL